MTTIQDGHSLDQTSGILDDQKWDILNDRKWAISCVTGIMKCHNVDYKKLSSDRCWLKTLSI